MENVGLKQKYLLQVISSIEIYMCTYTKYGTGQEWLRYVIQQCDGQHKRDYIAMQCDGNHFNLLHFYNRPCFCKRDSNERKREEESEAFFFF